MPQPIEQIVTESLLLVDSLAARQRELLRRIRQNERRQRKQLIEQTEPRVVRHGAVSD